MTKSCPRCNLTFAAKSIEIGGKRFLEQKYCDECGDFLSKEADAAFEREEQAELEKRNLARWRKVCPPNYEDTDPARLPSDAADAATSYSYGSKGLIFIGDSGMGKTRAMYLLLKRMMDQGYGIRVYTASEFRRKYSESAMKGESDKWLERAAKSDCLFIDDLGQMKITESSGEALLDLLEMRTRNRLPTFFTTQYTREKFLARFDLPEMGAAIRRRIAQFCDCVVLKR